VADPVYTSRVRIERIKGPIRHAYVEPFDAPIRFGVHGAIKHFYGVEPDEEIPATLDHIIAAVGGWLLGTLAGALAVRQIPVEPNKIRAQVEGDVEAVDRVLRIARIRVRYQIRIPSGMREAAERALATHQAKCPAAMSVRDCIAIEITADISDET
jgi:uncharacterized OsmC-like protein